MRLRGQPAPETLPLARRGRLSRDVVDGALGVALAVLALATYEQTGFATGDDPAELTLLSVSLLLAMTLPLTFRRRNPGAVVLIVGGAGVALPVLDLDSSLFAVFGILVAIHTMAAYGDRRDSLVTAAITALALAIVTVTGDLSLLETATQYLVFGVVWISGETIRVRRAYAVEMEERARLAEADREARAHRAVAEERARIARELHDVVAHEVSVIVVQAGAARRVLADHPDQAEEALAAIETSGRDALTEMRRLLGVLRHDDDAAMLRPQPGLGRLNALVDQMAEAGLPVAVEIDGEPRDLPAGIDLSAYRIVQEALTNSLKHAGPAAHARVRLGFGDDRLSIEVSDDGRGGAVRSLGNGSGHGLLGMQERVALFGGDLAAGPRIGGGYRVAAVIPTSSGSE